MRTSLPRTFLLLLVVLGIALAAGGPVTGQSTPEFVETDITADSTWSPDDGPYRIVADVEVTGDATLSIEPGTTVEIAEGVSLEVNGSLRATGTAAEPVRFTSPRTSPTPGSWDSIETVGSGGAQINLTHVHAQYATDGVLAAAPGSEIQVRDTTFSTMSGDGIRVETGESGTDLHVSATTFEDIEGDGIRGVRTGGTPLSRAGSWLIQGTDFESISGSAIDIEASTVRRVTVADSRFRKINETAVQVEADAVRDLTIEGNSVESAGSGFAVATDRSRYLTVTDNRIREGGVGVEVLARTNVRELRITENRVVESRTGVLVTHDPAGDGFFSFETTIARNNLSDNAVHGLHVQSGLFADPVLAVHNNTLNRNDWYGANFAVGELRQAAVRDNRITGNEEGGFAVSARHVRATTFTRNLVRDNAGPGISLDARREVSALQVRNNSLLDNAGEGLFVNNSVAGPGNYTIRDNLVAANAYGVHAQGPQTSRIESNEIVFNTYGLEEPIPLGEFDPGIGILVEDGQDNFYLVENDIYGNRIGLTTDTGGTVQADGNYWGSDSGAYHQSINPEGTGDRVVTERGWVDIIYAKSERVGTSQARPIANLSIDPETATPGQQVTISGEASSDPDGTVETYQFDIDGAITRAETPTRTVSFDEPGRYPVSLVVEDDLGIESAAHANATVEVQTQTTTTTTTTITTTTTAAPPDTTTTVPPTTTETSTTTTQAGIGVGGGNDGLFGALFSIGGILGAAFYLLALALGAIGMFQTITEQPLTINGRRVQLLAGAGIGIWAIFSILGPGSLLQISLAGLVAWALLTGISYLVARET